MNPPRLLSKRIVKQRLIAAGFTDTGRTYPAGDNATYSVWISDWGEPIMIPEEGPDKRCAEWVLAERMSKVLSTKPRTRK